ncbi:MAG TPA: MATE family efflux transporter [Gemmatimonadales bacterium]
MPTHSFRSALRAMIRLSVPVVFVQTSLMLTGMVDVIMVGRVSPEAIAAVALGNVYFFAVAIFGAGLLMALDPVVAQAVGAQDEAGIARGLQRGLALAAVVSVLASVLLLPAEPILRAARQPDAVVPLASAYAVVSIAGVVPFYLFIVFRQTMQAMHRMAPIVVTAIVGNVANIAFNWMLVFGHLGFPAMGAVGSSWATAASRWVMALGLLGIGWQTLRPHLRPLRTDAIAWRPLLQMARIGAPIGLQHQLEYGVFGVVGLMMGWFGTIPMAAHQVALNLAAFTFTVPWGVSAAAVVLVGNAVGRGDAPGARQAASAALFCGVTFMGFMAITMIAVPDLLARVYTDEQAVILIAVTLIPIAGVFQVFDGTQVVSIGILRGVADTRTPLLINILGFWLVGVPVSVWLAFRTPAGPRGLWWGLVVGLVIVSALLVMRVQTRLRGELRRVGGE